MKSIAILLIRIYQRIISPLLPGGCRFHPSCSEYAIKSLCEHGMILGTAYSIKRLLRCHPFNDGGYDPVPLRTCERKEHV